MTNEPVAFDGDASKHINSTYYSRSDFEDVDDLPLVIGGVEQSELEDKKTHETRLRLQLVFRGEDTKKAGLNQGNLKLLVQHFGKKTSGWIGRTVILYWDENVSFAGQLVGGLRLRIPKAGRMARPVEPQDGNASVPF